jgi:FMN-dependent NADH-azoreductase
MKLLHIDSSITGDQSASRGLTAKLASQWLAQNPDTEVDYLDLARQTPAHFNGASLGLRLAVAENDLTEAQKRENAVTEQFLGQFLAADVVIIGAPLYNFSIPSQLKAWIDRIAQAGRTFKYTASGPVGLATGKTVIIVSSRGGIYSSSEAGRAMEHQESYLRTVFGFMGVTDIRIVRAEGLAMGDEAKATALASAYGDINTLFNNLDEQAESVAA